MNWPSYLIQANIYLVLFYAFYVLVLQNETFFKWNRLFLVSSGALSFLIPLMQSERIRSMFVTKEIEEASQLAVSPGILLNEVYISSPGNTIFTITDWLIGIYIIGAIFFLCRFFWQLSRVSKSFREGSQAQSFFKRIKVSEELQSRESIVKHEEVHASQLHSADVIFFELISIINWFNPVVYAYKKSIKYIHEFIADEVASLENGKSEYALLLVSNVFGIQKEQLTNNFFNQSLLKKRIMMLHKTKSKKAALIKYGLSAPLFAAMIIFSSAVADDAKKQIFKIERAFTPQQLVNIPATATEKPSPREEAPVDISKDQTTEIKPALKEEDATEAAFKSIEKLLENSLHLKSQRDTSAIYDVRSIEVMPEYPGGMNAFYKWVATKGDMLYTKAAKEAGVSGRLIVTFVVEKDGSLTGIKTLGRDLGYGTSEAAKTLITQSQKWKPGIQKGKLVRVQFTLPIMLQMADNNPKNTTDTSVVRLSDPTNRPLVLINGKISTWKQLQELDPKKIESIQVLKDKQHIEKYGEKGKNGVILVTSKKE